MAKVLVKRGARIIRLILVTYLKGTSIDMFLHLLQESDFILSKRYYAAFRMDFTSPSSYGGYCLTA